MSKEKVPDEKYFDLFINKYIGTITVYSKHNYTEEELQIFDAFFNVISSTIEIRRQNKQLGCMMLDSLANVMKDYHEFYKLVMGERK